MLEALSHLLSGAIRKRLPWFVISVLATGGGIWVAVMTCLQAIDPQMLNLPHQPLMTPDILALHYPNTLTHRREPLGQVPRSGVN